MFRGYYIRCKAISEVISTFLCDSSTSDGWKQIISLGAGYDTSYFRLHASGLVKNLKYFEVPST
jgi:tRNA wybutosine-synthesizing protein 4